MNVVSGYAPQVGCKLEAKEKFWNQLDGVIESIETWKNRFCKENGNGCGKYLFPIEKRPTRVEV